MAKLLWEPFKKLTSSQRYPALMPRFTAAQFAAAAAAGTPRASAEFYDDEEWHAYQDSWMAPPVQCTIEVGFQKDLDHS